MIEKDDGIEDEKKVEKNITDIKTKLKDIDLSTKEYIKVDKNYTNNFDALSSNKQSFFIKAFNNIKFFLFKKEVGSKTKKVMIKIYKKVIGNKIFSLINQYKVLYFRAYVFIVTIFVLLCVIWLCKIVIENKVNSGYQNLIEIRNTKDEKVIKELISNSINDFRIASFLFKPFSLIPTEKVQVPSHIIDGGKQIAYTMNNLIKVYNNVNLSIKKDGVDNVEIATVLSGSKNEVFAIEKDLRKALVEYNSITDLNQGPLNAKFEIGKKYLNSLEKYLLIIKNNYETFLNILGDKKEKQYLVVFQNADEIRPTGGFMGSMGVIHIYKGKITKFDTQDVYAHEWNLKKEDFDKIKPPEGINKLTKILWLRDANYSSNYGNSSNSINFYMKKIGYNLDGIIYINNTIIEDFLKLTGNVSFNKIDENIRHNNFSEIMSLLVESKKFKEGVIGTPKQILFDFIIEFKSKLIKEGNYLSYLRIIIDHIVKREIVVYSFNEKENKLLQELDINGTIDYNSSIDFAYPVYTSISSNKSDRYVVRKYEKTIKQNKDCSIDTSLKLSLSHNFTLDDENYIRDLIKKYEIRDPKIMHIQGTGNNWQYIKVLLPKNAIIKEDRNYKIEETAGLKYVSFYLQTRRFETKSMTINYILPNEKCEKYTFNFYKQAGIRKYDIVIKDDDIHIEKKNISTDFIY
ncbi:DUF4012 domain-containing protein [Candidatus Gracilibacteria bacterium]|nr:DUF4012 domain-containing protein [Candidatus Gracilibacteria bacterium]